MDVEGHGLSGGARVKIASYEEVVKDYRAYIELVMRSNIGVDYVTMGFSMGGAMNAHLGLLLQSEAAKGNGVALGFKGAIFMAPSVHNELKPPACIIALLRCCCLKICPDARPPGIGKYMPDKISRSQEHNDYCRNDPLQDPVVSSSGIAFVRMYM